LPGFVTNPYPYLRRAQVFALSSRWEGLPTVLIEALALGTAVVSTDCPSGPKEILEDGKFGKLVPVGDVDAFASALSDQLRFEQLPVRPTAFAANGRYTLDAAATAYAAALRGTSE